MRLRAARLSSPLVFAVPSVSGYFGAGYWVSYYEGTLQAVETGFLCGTTSWNYGTMGIFIIQRKPPIEASSCRRNPIAKPALDS